MLTGAAQLPSLRQVLQQLHLNLHLHALLHLPLHLQIRHMFTCTFTAMPLDIFTLVSPYSSLDFVVLNFFFGAGSVKETY